MKAVLFQSTERCPAFQKQLEKSGVEYTILDFEDPEWIDFDYSRIDFLIYYPSFKFSSNHPLALQEVYDNLSFLHESYPQVRMFPDPGIIKYYNDKYRQFLFLKAHGYPMPETLPLFSEQSLELSEKKLGYPMVVKNRYGAGGGAVFRVQDKKELDKFYNLSRLNLFNAGAAAYFGKMLTERLFYYQLIKARKARYPFLSPPLLAQKFIKITRDLKTVVGNFSVVEAHWRYQVDAEMWKMNIDGGGTGVWGHVPPEAIDLSVRLAKDLKASWLNIDLLEDGDGHFLITEFSPVWHHYAYREKPSFVYQDDYNIPVPLEVSLDLERIIVESLMAAAGKQ